MIFPQWAFYGICTALLSAATMLMQERFKVDGAALAFWNKVVCVMAMTPFVIYYGFPHEIMFYIYMGFSALLYAISDVVYFSGISKAGAGTVSRVLPVSVIFSFLLWFAIDPSSFHDYLQKPIIAALIFAVLCLWIYCATHLRRCAISMKAARTVWFTIFATIVGPLIGKETTNSTDVVHGMYGYPFVQALMMIIFWALFFHAKKPLNSAALFSPRVLRCSLPFGIVSAIAMVTGTLALYRVDNPAYTSAVGYLNTFFILLAYAAMGRKNDGNVIAGIGMVACAAALIILKAKV